MPKRLVKKDKKIFGVCGGLGGSQHLAYRHFHSNGVQGGMIGIGVGLAKAAKLTAQGGIVAIMIGDGTLGQGMVYECMNLASIWRLPVLFVVENNRIAQTTETATTLAGSIEERGRAFALKTWRVDDADPEVFGKVEESVATVRDQGRPGLLVIDTLRMGPHSKGDDLRPAEEMEAIQRRDPLQQWGRRLSEKLKAQIEARNQAFLESVKQAAMQSAEARYAEIPRHIFTQAPTPSPCPMPATEDKLNVRGILNQALRHLLQSSDEVVLLGEDLHDPYGGAFKVTAGLSSDFPGRVISTPISEASITGTAIGLAKAGLKPILEIMFADFLSLCMDQIYNHAVKFSGIFPSVQVPLVIRTPPGGRRGYGSTHSQSPENVFAAIPGITLVYGSPRHAMGELLMQATLAWPYPVLFFEHKLLYGEICEPHDYEELPPVAGDAAAALFPTLIRRRSQPDLTLITYGGMLPYVERAAARLEEEEELAIEIVVPALLAPLPKQTLITPLIDRQRIVVIEETHSTYGIGAEILASLSEAGCRAQTLRIGTPPVPIASARSMEKQLIPDEAAIVEAILGLF